MSSALQIVAFSYLAVVSVVLAAIDVRSHRLPNAIVLPSYLVAVALLTAAVLAGAPASALVRAGLGMAALFAFYLLLRVLSRRGLGGGDVKLAGVLGLYLGWIGWDALAVGALAGFVLGGAAGMVLLLARRAHRSTRIPFGPAMLGGAWLAILLGIVADAGRSPIGLA